MSLQLLWFSRCHCPAVSRNQFPWCYLPPLAHNLSTLSSVMIPEPWRHECGMYHLGLNTLQFLILCALTHSWGTQWATLWASQFVSLLPHITVFCAPKFCHVFKGYRTHFEIWGVHGRLRWACPALVPSPSLTSPLLCPWGLADCNSAPQWSAVWCHMIGGQRFYPCPPPDTEFVSKDIAVCFKDSLWLFKHIRSSKSASLAKVFRWFHAVAVLRELGSYYFSIVQSKAMLILSVHILWTGRFEWRYHIPLLISWPHGGTQLEGKQKMASLFCALRALTGKEWKCT